MNQTQKLRNGFEKLERIVNIPVTFTTVGTLSINSGRGDEVTGSLVMRYGGQEEKPVIPGSSVKGVVRSTIEAMLHQAEGDGKICVPMACAPKDRNRNPILPPGRKEDCGEEARRRNNPRGGLEDACSACQMFGNTGLKGKVNFHDAIPAREGVATISRTHVALTRDTGTAAPQSLMTMETVPNGVEFKGSVALVNPDPWMVGAIIHVLELLPSLGVGAKKTSGYGELDVKTGDIEFPLRPESDKETPAEYRDRCLKAWAEKAKVDVTNLLSKQE
jgi:CRISPR-associated RAMP protein (TIGR02581 family)